MAEQVVVTNDSKERVAFELMNLIAAQEKGEHDRAYFLRLYYECRRVVHGRDPQSSE